MSTSSFSRSQGGPDIPPLEVIDPRVWEGQVIPDRRWLVDQVIPFGAVTMLGGDGGLGKSHLMQILLTAAATGNDWLGLPTASVKALGLFCEDDAAELQRRQASIIHHYACAFGDLENLGLISRVGQDNTLMRVESYGQEGVETPLFLRLCEQAKSSGAQLIVLDSLHCLFAGDENSRSQAQQFVNLLHRMAYELDGAVVVTAHPSLTGLQTGSGLSGSTAWNNAVRSRLYLTRPKRSDGEPSNVRILQSLKSNYSMSGQEWRLRWIDGVFVSENEIDDVGYSEKLAQVEELFLGLLQKRDAECRPVSHKSRAANYAPREFAKHPLGQPFKMRDFAAAMERLFAEGKIKVDVYGNRPSREFERIVVAAKFSS